MANPALVQSTAAIAGAGATVSQTFGVATTTGDLIVVGLIVGTNAVPGTSVTDSKSNTYTKLFSLGKGVGWTEFYYCFNVTGGASHSVSIHNPNSLGVNGFARQYTNIATASALDQSATNTGTVANFSAGPTASTTNAVDLIIGVFGDDWGAALTYTPGTGFGNLIHNSTGAAGDISMEDMVVTSTGTQTATETCSQPPSWVGGVIAFKGTGGGGATQPALGGFLPMMGVGA